MKKLRRFLAFVLCAALCFLLLTGCGSRDTIRFKMIAELNQEEFCVAFRKGDPLCDIFTAALKELSADGQISWLSAQYLGTDYTCMEALPGALQLLETQPEPGRKLRIGVQDGIAPISSSRDDGSFGGLIPDLAQLVAEKLGWTFEYMVINSDNVAAELGSGNIDCAWMAASFSGSSSSVSLSPGWLRNTHELVVRSDSRYTRKNSLKGKVIRRLVLRWRKAAFPSRLKVKDLTYIMTAPRRNTPRTKNERRSKQHDRRKLYSFNGRSNRRREGIFEKGCRLRGIPFREYLDKNSDRPCGNFIRWPDRDLCYVRS